MNSEAKSRSHTIAADGGGLTAVAVLLVVIHFVAPVAVRQALVFDYSQFRGYTLFTAAFVHASNAHLYGNLVGYGLTTVYAYMLCLNTDGLHWFRRAVISVLVLIPVLANLTSFVLLSWQYPGTDPVSRGFSGVVAGFGGLLLVALYRAFKEEFNADVAWAVCLSVFLLLMQVIDFRYRGRLSIQVTGLVLLGMILVAGQYVYNHDVALSDRATRRRIIIGGSLAVLVGVVLAVLVLGLFPQADTLVDDSNFTNIFAHAAGFLWGIVVSAGVLMIIESDTVPPAQ